MSIETELQKRIGRLQTAFTAANTAITGKGGTAADDISGLADEIRNIPSGSSVTVEPLSVTANGTYTAPSGKAYSPVTVNVPTSGSGIIVTEVVSIAAESINVATAIALAQYKCVYKNSFVAYITYGDAVPTSSYTSSQYFLFHSGQTTEKAKNIYWSGQHSANSALPISQTLESGTLHGAIQSDGTIPGTTSTSSTTFLAAGNGMRVVEIPIKKDWTTDLTLWGESNV